MPEITIKGLGTVTVSDDFVHLPPDRQQATVEEIAQQIRSRGVAGDIKKSYSSMSTLDFAGTAITNIPSSAKKFVENTVQPFIHPIDTVKNIDSIGKAVLQ